MKYKKSLIIFIFTIFIFLSIYFYLNKIVKGVPVEGISERAKSYVKEKKEIASNAGETFINNCFNIKTPYNITNNNIEESDSKCLFSAKMLDPIGYMDIYIEPKNNNNNTENNTGIQLRKRESDLYVESKIADNIIKFSNSQDRSVIYFIYTKDKLLTISFTDLIKVDKIKDEDVKIIVNSVL